MTNYSQSKSDFVAGAVARDFPDAERGWLRRVVDSALLQATIFDATPASHLPGKARGRSDAALRVDAADQSRKPTSARAYNRERDRARQDAAMDEIRGMHTRSKGFTRADLSDRPQRDMPPARQDGGKEAMADAIRNAWKGKQS